METFLSLLARKSALTRQICVIAFEAFTEVIDRNALQILVDTLYAEENEKGYRALFVPEFEEELTEADTDEDEDEDDGFFVPHGYLSEDEGCDDDDSDEKVSCLSVVFFQKRK